MRSDCTTRNQRKRLELHHHVDAIEERILELAAADRRKAERPLLDGQAVMDRFDVGPGPMVGKALKYLLELKRTEPDLDIEATESRLDTWWQSNS